MIADHVRAATFLIGDGVVPSNKDRGYILRKLIRRAITHANFLQSFPEKVLASLVDGVIDVYMDCYPELGRKRAEIADVFEQEQSAFVKTYARGKKILEKKELDDALRAEMRKVLDEFKKKFVAERRAPVA